MNKAVIFDMDGVLIDSEIVFTKCLSMAFEAAGYDVPAAEFCRFAGIEFPKKFQTVINEKNLPVTVEELTVHYRNAQKVLLQDFGVLLKPGVHASSFAVCRLSNRPLQQQYSGAGR